MNGADRRWLDRTGRRCRHVRLSRGILPQNKEPRPGADEHIEWMGQMERAHGRAEVIIGKQRHGPTGTVELQFEAELTRFGNLARAVMMPEIR